MEYQTGYDTVVQLSRHFPFSSKLGKVELTAEGISFREANNYDSLMEGIRLRQVAFFELNQPTTMQDTGSVHFRFAQHTLYLVPCSRVAAMSSSQISDQNTMPDYVGSCFGSRTNRFDARYLIAFCRHIFMLLFMLTGATVVSPSQSHGRKLYGQSVKDTEKHKFHALAPSKI